MSTWASNPVNPDGTPNIHSDAISRQPKASTGELDRDAFLQLLIAQMQNQDPLNPMDDRDFIAQMAQFSALEQQQAMTRSMEQQQAYSLLGRIAIAQFFDETLGMHIEADGPVMYVSRKAGEIFLGVETEAPRLDSDGEIMLDDAGRILTEIRVIDVPLARVSVVEDMHITAMQLQGILDGVANTRDINLIGSYIQAIIRDERGRPSEFIEGQVEFVRFQNGQAVLMVNGRDVLSNEIFSVSEIPLVIGKPVTGVTFNANGTQTEVTGNITGINIRDNRTYLQIGNNEVRLQRIDHLVEALQLIGREVKHDLLNGIVDGVSVRGGEVYIHSGNDRVHYGEFREEGGKVIG